MTISYSIKPANYILIFMMSITACKPGPEYPEGSFGFDVNFLENHLPDLVVLRDPPGDKQIAVVPAYQGRIMSSSSSGMSGHSYGWINYDLIASGEIQDHINAYGGEERIWFGPEGGQFSIFFEPGAPFDFDHWQTPKEIDTEPFEVVRREPGRITLGRSVKLENYSKHRFDFHIERRISLLNADSLQSITGIDLPGNLDFVAYETMNSLTNTGTSEWTKETGMLSIWLLSMLKPAPDAIIILPYRKDNTETPGPVVNDTYFGKVPSDRLIVTDSVLFFSADGKYRSKIGIPPRRARPFIGSFDPAVPCLTIVHCEPSGRTDYVNSSWEIQKYPFRGDALNAYNDGPLEDGSQMGPFYELETSSPAANLKPGETLAHTQQVMHFEGPVEDLNRIARSLLGVDLYAEPIFAQPGR